MKLETTMNSNNPSLHIIISQNKQPIHEGLVKADSRTLGCNLLHLSSDEAVTFPEIAMTKEPS